MVANAPDAVRDAIKAADMAALSAFFQILKVVSPLIWASTIPTRGSGPGRRSTLLQWIPAEVSCIDSLPEGPERQDGPCPPCCYGDGVTSAVGAGMSVGDGGGVRFVFSVGVGVGSGVG